MNAKKLIKIFLIFFFLIFLIIIYFNSSDKDGEELPITEKIEGNSYSLNVIENVSYSSKDVKGNEYIIEANKGEIDIDNSNIIFLTQVNAIIKLADGDLVLIDSYHCSKINVYTKRLTISMLAEILKKAKSYR